MKAQFEKQSRDSNFYRYEQLYNCVPNANVHYTSDLMIIIKSLKKKDLYLIYVSDINIYNVLISEYKKQCMIFYISLSHNKVVILSRAKKKKAIQNGISIWFHYKNYAQRVRL